MIIGNREIDNNIWLAPMAGITDIPCRVLSYEMGAGFAFTEMVSAKGYHYNSQNTKNLIETSPGEKGTGIQLFGSDPGIIAETIKNLNDSAGYLFDINMGCPAPKIVKNKEGSALMKDIKAAFRVISAAVAASEKPVTVKFRKGWDQEHVNAVEFAVMAEEAGAAALTIHGRTRDQFYSGTADLDIIAGVKSAVKIPVIGNGDVCSGETAVKMLNYTKADGVMIGRAAHGNPWIFKEISHYIRTAQELPPPSMKERISVIMRHLDMLIELKGERTAVREMRTHISRYLKGLKDVRRVRERLHTLIDRGTVAALLSSLRITEGQL